MRNMAEAEHTTDQTPPGRLGLVWHGLVALSERPWLRCLALALLGAGVRFPALQGPLLWDDLYLAGDNPFIKSPLLILEAFRHYLFPDSFAGHYRPVQTVSYVFDYLIWNTDAYGYHLSNLLWHIGSGVLLYLLLQRLLSSLASHYFSGTIGGREGQRAINLSGTAFVIALLWIVHPVHSAAVDYVSGRADSLVFFFASGGWLLYLRAREISRKVIRWSCYSVALLSGLLALCSRETGFVWMVVFLLYLFVFDRKPTLRAKLVVLSCCLALASAYGTLRALPEYRPGHDVHPSQTGAARSVLILRALGDYGRLMIWPANLHMERDVVNGDSLRDTSHWRQTVEIEYLSIAGLLVAAILFFGASRKGAAQPIRIFGAGWFLITFLPISNLFDLNATVAEHWLYLPSVGFFVFLAGCYLELPQFGKRIALAVTCIFVLGLSARSFVRSSDWASEETFYRQTLLSGGSSPRMCVNLAAIYSKRGENAKAESMLRKVLQADPNYQVARNNLASILSGGGRTKEAEQMFDSASKVTQAERATYPRTWAALLNLAHLAHARDDDQSALAIVDKARRDYPGTWPLVSFEAELLRRTRGVEAALPIVEEFVHDHWWHCEASIALGKLCWEKGDAGRAEEAFRHASWLDMHDADALSALSLLRVQQNRLEDALQSQNRAVSRQPDQARPYLLLSSILEKMGRPAEAQAALARVSYLEALARPQPTAN
jgi:tetratricopeptide (TPR) repeat protein